MTTTRLSVLMRYSRRRWIIFCLGVLVGIVAAGSYCSFAEKARLMGGHSLERSVALVDVVRRVGTPHLRSCPSKVEELHRVLARSPEDSRSPRAGHLVASILIDGDTCTTALLEHIDCSRSLPRIPLFGDFVGMEIAGEDVGASLQDEGGLVLWMLNRIHPEQHLDYPLCCGNDQDWREALQDAWHHRYGPPPR